MVDLKGFMIDRVSQVDVEHLNPDERAELINTLIFRSLGLDTPEDVIKQPMHWDVQCFAVKILASFIVEMEAEDLIPAIKLINNYIYSIHYSGKIGVDPHLGPGRDEHEKMWLDIIGKMEKENVEES